MQVRAVKDGRKWYRVKATTRHSGGGGSKLDSVKNGKRR